jgi:sterol desaturase/sphingolipid hydroxylase (fatty acid hydroxylase superfamily)
MKTELKTYLYIFTLAALICGLVAHIAARLKVERYESQQAEAIRKAMQQPSQQVEKTDAQKQELASIRITSLFGHTFITLGALLLLLWFFLGGRNGVWLPLLLLLFDVPFWMF